MSDALKRMTIARTQLLLKSPFFGALALRLDLEEDPRCETVWTDGVTLGINPDFVIESSRDLLQGVLCHEVLHLALGHHVRRGDRQARQWNMASDYAVNPIVEEAGFSLPQDRLREEGFDGLEAEKVYELLEIAQRKNRAPAPKDGGMHPGAESDAQDRQSDQPKAVLQADPGKCGEVRDFPDRSEHGREQQERDVFLTVREAAETARSWGKMPANVQRILSMLERPKIPWREVLSRFLEEISRNDYDWAMPNRRYMPGGFYLPVLRDKTFGRVVLLVDTSASISSDDLTSLSSECFGVLELYKDDVSLTTLYVDTEVAGVQELRSGTVPRPAGGGGTSFRPGFEWIEKQDRIPAGAIYFTDGNCADFPDEPEFPVLWLLKHDNLWFRERVPFGEVLVMEESVPVPA